MKNSEIHNGLEKKEIRNFLSETMRKIIYSKWAIDNNPLPEEGLNTFDWNVKLHELYIEKHSKLLEFYQQNRAIVQLIKMNGWDEFDVSDETSKNSDEKLHLDFIGTQEEYNSLISKINA